MIDDALTPPAGFVEAQYSRFLTHNGPVFSRVDGAVRGEPERAFLIADIHTNGLGLVHGGMVATFMDMVMGQAVREMHDGSAVTIQMSVNYLGMARRGEWLHARGRVTRMSRHVIFAEASAFVGAREVTRASGMFKTMGRGR